MTTFLIAANSSGFDSTMSDQTLAERLAVGVPVAVTGILIVFFVLAFLWGVLELFKLFTYTLPRKNKPVTLPADPIDARPVCDDVLPEKTGADNDAAVVAAIVAAISEFEGKPASSFRVVSFRKSRK